MGEIRIRQNYENYERVEKAFKEFIHALVWESMDIDGGVHEDEVNEHIDKYCRANGDQMIALANDSVTKFITSLKERYKVTYYECGENAIIKSKVCSISSNNLEVMLKKAAKFYRNGKCPQVNIFDNELGKYIAEWD